jgi:hypothetical protein
LNPLLETTAKTEEVEFLVPEKGGSDHVKIGKSFVVLATLAVPTSTSQIYNGSGGISLALRNRFVTVRVSSPDLSSSPEIREKIAYSVLSRMSHEKINAGTSAGIRKGVFNPDIPSTLLTQVLNNELLNSFSKAIGKIEPPLHTIRDIAFLATAVCWTYGIVHFKKPEDLVDACMLKEEWLASDEADTLILHTVDYNKPGDRFFFSSSDRHSPMWQMMAALCVASASGQHLFFQV